MIRCFSVWIMHNAGQKGLAVGVSQLVSVSSQAGLVIPS
jgi:hypothetical protein